MKSLLRISVVALALALLIVAGTVPALAASPSAANLTANPQYARDGVDVPVFGIDLIASGSCTEFTDVVVDFAQVAGGGTFEPDDLDGNPDGIKLWQDTSKTGANQDVLDDGDTAISGTFSFSGLRATLTLAENTLLPMAEEGNYTYFLTIRLSGAVTNGDDFTMTIPADGLKYGGSVLCLSDPSITAATTDRIVADLAAPVATFTKPATQTDNLFWTINEPVVGDFSNAARLFVAGTATEIPVTVSYDAAAQKIVADPAIPLTAGQSYDAKLLPDGPGAITDRAGNPLPARTDTFRAATSVSETAPGSTYYWRSFFNSATYGGSYVSNNFGGATISYRFNGPSVVWYTVTDPYQGTARVSIDGRSFGSFNNYSATARYKVARTFTGLSSGSHLITIKVTGLKGSTAGRDTRVAIDAFRSSGVTDVTPPMGMSWGAVSAAGANGGSYRATRLQNTTMTFVFNGTSIAWRTVRGPAMGKALVYIDGVLKGTFDNYRSTTTYNYMRAFLNLAPGQHTITIKAAGTKSSSATNTIVAVDGFEIG